VFATDGSGQGGQAGWGLTSVRTTHEGMQADTDAGFDPEAAVREECGRVITNPNQAEHLGATRATNNTQESSVRCTAVCHALTGARELARPGEEVLILSDSQIAICTTTGAWASRKNTALVERNRRALAALHGPMARRCGSSTSERMPATE
jgi:ribonuclease HI